MLFTPSVSHSRTMTRTSDALLKMIKENIAKHCQNMNSIRTHLFILHSSFFFHFPFSFSLSFLLSMKSGREGRLLVGLHYWEFYDLSGHMVMCAWNRTGLVTWSGRV